MASKPQQNFLFQCFKLFDSIKKEAQSWHAARTTCTSFGGNLVTVSSAELQGIVCTFFDNGSNKEVNQYHGTAIK